MTAMDINSIFLKTFGNVEEALAAADTGGILIQIEGTPTGLYADRDSYAGTPLLSFVLDSKLVCYAHAERMSHVYNESSSMLEMRKGLGGKDVARKIETMKRDPHFNNEQIAHAAASLDSAIRNSERITVAGMLEDNNARLRFEFLTTPSSSYLFPAQKFNEMYGRMGKPK